MTTSRPRSRTASTAGTVNADLNAGGITGAMARENDLDPEDDYTTAGSESLNFTFKTRRRHP